MDTAKGTEKIAQSGPDPFHGVAVDFTDPIAIIISRIFPVRVTHRVMTPSRLSQMVIGRRFVGVDRGDLGRRAFDFRLDRLLLGVLTNSQANLSRRAAHHSLNRRTIREHRAQAAPTIGTLTGRISTDLLGRALFSRILKHLIRFRCQIG